jgi:hypothetical protein
MTSRLPMLVPLAAWLVLLLANSSSKAAPDEAGQSAARVVNFVGGSATITTVNGSDHVVMRDGRSWTCSAATGGYDEIVSFYRAFQAAIAAGSRERVAEMAAYPLRLNVVGEPPVFIGSRTEFIQQYETIFPEGLAARIQSATPEDVSCYGDNAALGTRGEVWESGSKVLAVNRFPSDVPSTNPQNDKDEAVCLFHLPADDVEYELKRTTTPSERKLIKEIKLNHADAALAVLPDARNVNIVLYPKTPLLGVAVGTRNPAIVEALLQRGADPNLLDCQKRPTLWFLEPSAGDGTELAAEDDSNSVKIADLLVAHGAKIEGRQNADWRGELLCNAAIHGQVAFIEWLLKHGANIEEESFGFAPLQCAMEGGYMNIAEWLISHGAKVDEKTRNEITVLTNAGKTVEGTLLAGLQINGSGDGRQAVTVAVLRAYKKAGLIASKRAIRSDFDDYYVLKRPTTFIGHDILLIVEDHGRDGGDGSGGTPTFELSVVLRVNGDARNLERFAEANRCDLRDYYDLAGQWEMFKRVWASEPKVIHPKIEFSAGRYAKLTCDSYPEHGG